MVTRTGSGTYTNTHAGMKTNTDACLFVLICNLFYAFIDVDMDICTHTHTHTHRSSMSSSAACIDKYVCARVSSQTSPQCTAGKERETRVCQCGKVRGPVSLSLPLSLQHSFSLSFLFLHSLVFSGHPLPFPHSGFGMSVSQSVRPSVQTTLASPGHS